ncbi:hypothetical protein H4P12_08760 [Paracoccus sp. 11-3]|uniref:Uncharacterized protein n=1 Tax=Paracoccus amoyensis TaxID=2760093 RepID=A0A926J615_9RHOB|nr:hypothetical protein [Paracoccus amoyensis]MBC9246802.1 hypothetical protein [Paracoccus amoyensis]
MKPIHLLTAVGFMGIALPASVNADPFFTDQVIRDIISQSTARHLMGDGDDRRPYFHRYDDRHKAHPFSRDDDDDDDDDDDRRWHQEHDDDD